MKPLRLVFCGTPEFAVPTLEALVDAGHEVAAVLTQPDRPVGRRQVMTAPAVKLRALELGLAVDQPETIRRNEPLRARLEALAPDAIVVVAYGRILPEWMLQLPRLGCINLHGSLLPRHRGAAPIQWALALGDRVTGNTTMLLDAGLDTGPILLQQTVELTPEMTSMELFPLLATRGAPLMVETLQGLAAGTLVPQAQDASQATLARLLTREDGRIEFAQQTATEIWNRWRGFQPWPGVFTVWQGRKLIVHRLRPAELAATAQPGEVRVQGSTSGSSAGQRLLVACAGGSWLELVEVQLEGRGRVRAEEFLRGLPDASAIRFGTPAESEA